jgi:glucose-6-phosphate isomerase
MTESTSAPHSPASTPDWQAFCDHYLRYPELGISIDFSRVRFDAGFFEKMAPLCDVAFKEMTEVEAGAIANADEQRMVGHYWLRNAALAPTAELREQIESGITAAVDFAKAVHAGDVHAPSGQPFRNVLCIGIGGSALGPQLLKHALVDDDAPVHTWFFDNTDPDGMARVLDEIGDGLAQTLAIVTSKSGGTAETRNGMLQAAAAYEAKGLDFARHAVAITGDGSKLDREAVDKGWLKRFKMEDWIGGRTSLMSTVGLVPAALQGIDIAALLTGAADMDIRTRSTEVRENLSMLLALSWYSTGDGKGKKDMVVLPYKDRLELFSKYLQQLIMESLGKEKDRDGNVVNQGLAVYGNKGSTDQHAYVQQLRDGIDNFFATYQRRLPAGIPARHPLRTVGRRPRVGHSQHPDSRRTTPWRTDRRVRARGLVLRIAGKHQRLPPARSRSRQEGSRKIPRLNERSQSCPGSTNVSHHRCRPGRFRRSRSRDGFPHSDPSCSQRSQCHIPSGSIPSRGCVLNRLTRPDVANANEYSLPFLLFIE